MADERYNLGKTVKNYEYEKFENTANTDVHGFEATEYVNRSTSNNIGDFDEAYIDNFEDLYDVPYAATHTSIGVVTPMEYYANCADVTSEQKLRLTAEQETSVVPTYFWLETLKNWCTYRYVPFALNDRKEVCYGGAVLCVWDGQSQFVQLDTILQQQYSCQLTLKQIQNDVDAIKDDNDVLAKQQLDRYKNIILANLFVYRFPYERLNTVAVNRVYSAVKTPDFDVTYTTYYR